MSTAYDLTPYDGSSYAHTHPDALATVAVVRGMQPAAIDSCRVLEIGCASGLNLIPMALSLPGGQFVGLDLSARQIDAARALTNELNVPNVTFHQQDIRAWSQQTAAAGDRYDYIVAHGVYSWVAADARQALLAGVRRALAPQGVAYVSYNTYPGWHMLEAMRRMMLFHVAGIDDPRERARQAREFVGFLVEGTEQQGLFHSSMLSAFHTVVSNYWHGILNMPGRTDSLLLHDELEEVNEPCYFHEFLAQIDTAGLAYLGDAEFDSTLAISLPDDTRARLLELLPDGAQIEQYLDFLRNRTFRRSLLVGQQVALSPSIGLETLDRLYFSSQAPLQAGAQTDSQSVSIEIGMGNARLVTDHPVTVVAFDYLREIAPARACLDELLAVAYARMLETNPHMQAELSAARQDPQNPRRVTDASQLRENLLLAYCTSGELVEFHTRPGDFATEIGDRPRASRWARWQAGQGSHYATNLCFVRTPLDDAARLLLPLLDGSRDVDGLARELLHQPGAADLLRAGTDPEDQAGSLAEGVAGAVYQHLQMIAQQALLAS